ncbi:SPL1 [Scenedesmus sp. PABB004]|nr:SPL1 [Scenedesmus sp. PABB004]
MGVNCQVRGCGVNLTALGKPYSVKRRTCPWHLAAAAVQLDAATHGDGLYRFCHQCGSFEAVERFDRGKRSCRARLERRRASEKHRRAVGNAARLGCTPPPAAVGGVSACDRFGFLLGRGEGELDWPGPLAVRGPPELAPCDLPATKRARTAPYPVKACGAPSADSADSSASAAGEAGALAGEAGAPAGEAGAPAGERDEFGAWMLAMAGDADADLLLGAGGEAALVAELAAEAEALERQQGGAPPLARQGSIDSAACSAPLQAPVRKVASCQQIACTTSMGSGLSDATAGLAAPGGAALAHAHPVDAGQLEALDQLDQLDQLLDVLYDEALAASAAECAAPAPACQSALDGAFVPLSGWAASAAAAPAGSSVPRALASGHVSPAAFPGALSDVAFRQQLAQLTGQRGGGQAARAGGPLTTAAAAASRSGRLAAMQQQMRVLTAELSQLHQVMAVCGQAWPTCLLSPACQCARPARRCGAAGATTTLPHAEAPSSEPRSAL